MVPRHPSFIEENSQTYPGATEPIGEWLRWSWYEVGFLFSTGKRSQIGSESHFHEDTIINTW